MQCFNCTIDILEVRCRVWAQCIGCSVSSLDSIVGLEPRGHRGGSLNWPLSTVWELHYKIIIISWWSQAMPGYSERFTKGSHQGKTWQAQERNSLPLDWNITFFLTELPWLTNNNSFVGLNLIVWTLCGVIAIGGALCFAELGTRVRESGGDWAYLRVGLGSAPAFVSAWLSLVLNSSSIALVSLSSGEYLLSPFFNTCGMPVSLYTVTRRKNLFTNICEVTTNENRVALFCVDPVT